MESHEQQNGVLPHHVSSPCLCCHDVLQHRRVRKPLLRRCLFETGCYLPVSLGTLQLVVCTLPSYYEGLIEAESVFQDLFKADGR